MYGLDNSTNARFLRKSLQSRQLRNKNDSVPPPKIQKIDENASEKTKKAIQRAQAKNRTEANNKKTKSNSTEKLKENEKQTKIRSINANTKQKERTDKSLHEISENDMLVLSTDDDEEINNEVISFVIKFM